MKKTKYSVPAIHCGHCIHTIEMELSELDGVISVNADLEKKEVSVEFSDPANEDLLVATLKEINYPPIG